MQRWNLWNISFCCPPHNRPKNASASSKKKSLPAFGSRGSCIIFCYGRTLIIKRMSRSWFIFKVDYNFWFISKLFIFINLRLHKIYVFFQICFRASWYSPKAHLWLPQHLKWGLTSLCTILVILKFVDQLLNDNIRKTKQQIFPPK